ncbi:hypothetical protein Pcinc_000866 [Petrolisthes cinctipes]|uniref:Uncharacterized protein n=1 Tax=Petrolisthes cinctipes TaxID=88211 RepID=A0AAE1GPD0_PETCI|nr:hypothetical protein Pcinc_000866 [Petrolisthes cinctipes]
METSKKKVPVKRASRVGKKLNRYSLQDKAKVIELIEKVLKNAEIVRQTGFPEGTVRNFKRQKEEIKASLKVASKLFTGNVQASQRLLTNYSSTNRLIAVMEFHLERWIEGRFKSKGSINGPQIRNQALLLYNAICKKLAGLPNLRKRSALNMPYIKANFHQPMMQQLNHSQPLPSSVQL